jgi:hypothetical protein
MSVADGHLMTIPKSFVSSFKETRIKKMFNIVNTPSRIASEVILETPPKESELTFGSAQLNKKKKSMPSYFSPANSSRNSVASTKIQKS